MIAKLKARLLLSRAKHPSLRGHAKMALRVARYVPSYDYGEDELFSVDGAPRDVADRRRRGFERLASSFAERSNQTLKASAELEGGLADLEFVNAHRVPFPFQRYVASRLKVGCVVAEATGPRIRDLGARMASTYSDTSSIRGACSGVWIAPATLG
jgi:glutamate-1-semialdehyde 2,1-aminomutase